METFIATTLSQFHTVNGLSLDAIERRWRKREQLRVRSSSSSFKSLRVEKCRPKLFHSLENMLHEGLVECITIKSKRGRRSEKLWRLITIEPIEENGETKSKTPKLRKASLPFMSEASQHKNGWQLLKDKFKDGTLQTYIQSTSKSWNEVDWDSVKEEKAVKWSYDPKTCVWNSDTTLLVKIHPDSFAKGAMRKCFRMKKYNPAFLLADTPTHKDFHKASPYVAKEYYGQHAEEANNNDGQVYKDDIVLQMECSNWSNRYNSKHPPKQIEFVHVWLIQMIERKNSPYYAVERFINGKYVKYNSNSEFVNDGINEDGTALSNDGAGYLRSTPQAFSHFTYQESGKRCMVVDMQGVDDLLTDPQMHTLEECYGMGDLVSKSEATQEQCSCNYR